MRHRLRHTLRSLSATLAALLVAAPLFSALHLATVQHVACPEHRTLEHAHTAEPSSHDAPAGVTAERLRTKYHGQHQACSALCTSHKDDSVPTAALPLRDSLAVPCAFTVAWVARAPIVSFAPKTSPPIV